MTLNEKVEAVIGNECLLDITPYIGIKGLKKAYIGLAEYDCRTHTYETYCNHYVEKEDLRDYLLKKIPEIPVYATPFALALIRGKLDEHGILNSSELHEGTDGKDKTISLNSSEWLSFYTN